MSNPNYRVPIVWNDSNGKANQSIFPIQDQHIFGVPTFVRKEIELTPPENYHDNGEATMIEDVFSNMGIFQCHVCFQECNHFLTTVDDNFLSRWSTKVVAFWKPQMTASAESHSCWTEITGGPLGSFGTTADVCRKSLVEGGDYPKTRYIYIYM